MEVRSCVLHISGVDFSWSVGIKILYPGVVATNLTCSIVLYSLFPGKIPL